MIYVDVYNKILFAERFIYDWYRIVPPEAYYIVIMLIGNRWKYDAVDLIVSSNRDWISVYSTIEIIE